MKERRLGVHTSIAGGVHLSIERAKELECNTVQIFSHNPRQWLVREIPTDSILQFKELRKSYDINPVFIHTSYLINLAASDNGILERSIELLIQEMDIADLLNADYVILHTGSASQDSEEVGRKRAIEALKRVARKKEWRSKLLLENTAGERGDISSHIKDIAEIIDKTGSPLIGGVVIDTCHAFAAGYDITSENGMEELADEIRRYLGIESVKLIHLNDSKKGHGSHVDRHEHIGEGCIGKRGLKKFINHPAFKTVPLILETPKKSEEDDPRNLKIVRGLF
ncbi:MAG: deoxyribonuclease IV [Nitrospirae bacterium]|nr:deoxyribonuclease IV [Nitrospirota bacterium]MCL5978033.1 deoxyribonuclease IV [Nitrospirota bacterium]